MDYLRALLTAHGALPERDEALAKLERRITAERAQVLDSDDRRVLTEYATWRVLHHVRYRAHEHPAARTWTRSATMSMRAATALLAWLRARAMTLGQLSQGELDQWLNHGPPLLANQVSDFLTWAAARRAAPSLAITRLVTATGPATGDARRQALITMLLTGPDVATIDRVAGCLNLMYAQQLSRIATMTRSQVRISDDVLSIRFGRGDVIIDEPLAGHIRDQLSAPLRHHSIGAPGHSNWLFPGHLPGRPITAAALADLLGIAVTTAVDWAHTSGGDWANYAADTARRLSIHPAADPFDRVR